MGWFPWFLFQYICVNRWWGYWFLCVLILYPIPLLIKTLISIKGILVVCWFCFGRVAVLSRLCCRSDCSELVQVPTAAVSSWVQYTCHVQRTAFPITLPHHHESGVGLSPTLNSYIYNSAMMKVLKCRQPPTCYSNPQSTLIPHFRDCLPPKSAFIAF